MELTVTPAIIIDLSSPERKISEVELSDSEFCPNLTSTPKPATSHISVEWTTEMETKMELENEEEEEEDCAQRTPTYSQVVAACGDWVVEPSDDREKKSEEYIENHPVLKCTRCRHKTKSVMENGRLVFKTETFPCSMHIIIPSNISLGSSISESEMD
jgi:hypothetical protein